MDERAPVPAGKIEIAELIDAQPIGGFILGLAALCGLILAADGFDTQAIGYAGPAIAKEWGIEKSALGPVFSAGLLGLLIGSLVVGPLADSVGRRSIMLAATAWFGIGALLTSFATSLDQMLWLRFLTGLGLGGALPNTVALVSEYAPKRLRATVITSMFCGFSIGAALGRARIRDRAPIRMAWRVLDWRYRPFGSRPAYFLETSRVLAGARGAGQLLRPDRTDTGANGCGGNGTSAADDTC
jgi:MFS family permease